MIINKENQKINGSIFTIENDTKYHKSEGATNEEAISQCSSKTNIFEDSSCYFLYLVGRAWNVALERIPPKFKCRCIFALVRPYLIENRKIYYNHYS